MHRHIRNLLVLAMICSFAPASAERLSASDNASSASSDCPYERARLAAAASSGAGTTTVTLTSVPDNSLLNLGRRSEFFAP